MNLSADQSAFRPLFWEELRDLLGPFLAPIVNPAIDYLQIDANRAFILDTLITVCVFLIVLTYVAYELPAIYKWIISTAESQKSKAPSTQTPTTSRTRTTAPTRRASAPRQSHAEQVGDVHVGSKLTKKRESLVLDVEVTNQSDHQIEMVVVDLHPPEGIEFKTGSFRMQRIGTIQPGTSRSAVFRLTHHRGLVSDITGYVEFMSSSYEITKVDIPPPEIE